MENIKGYSKLVPSNKIGNEPAIDKLANFCSVHSLFKSDEELRDSFENLSVTNYPSLENATKERHLRDLEALKEILPVLYELGGQLCAGSSQYQIAVSEQTDSCNRLYASLKRHPE